MRSEDNGQTRYSIELSNINKQLDCRNFFNVVQRYYKSSAVAEMGDRLATIDMGRKLGDVPLFCWGELGPI